MNINNREVHLSLFPNSFQGKTVLVTGHTGFKGSWLCYWLNRLGAKVVGVSLHDRKLSESLSVELDKNFFSQYQLDIRNLVGMKGLLTSVKPDLIFHLAAQAIVGTSYSAPIDTWTTNVTGTANLLEACCGLESDCSVVVITSDKVYKNQEWCWGYREDDQLGSSDPYSASKAAAELVIKSYIDSFCKKEGNIRMAVARAGNVIGGGDWSEGRLIPDCARAWLKNTTVEIRNPNSTRPWQHVLEPLSGYLCLADNLLQSNNLHGECFNFGPLEGNDFCVFDVVSELGKYFEGAETVDISESYGGPPEQTLLKLSVEKAKVSLNWRPLWSFERTVKETAEWYVTCDKKPSHVVMQLMDEQIASYEKEKEARGSF